MSHVNAVLTVFFQLQGMASRFFRGDSDSDSDSSSSSSSSSGSSSSENERRQPAQRATFSTRRMLSSDESDDDVKRVVKSAKNKRMDELQSCIKLIDNAKKINDWVSIGNGNQPVFFVLYCLRIR